MLLLQGKQATPLVRYSVAALAVFAGLVFRLVLIGFLGPELPYVTFFLAVMFSAWFGGVGPGIFSSALTLAVLAALARTMPSHSPHATNAVGAIVFLGVSAFISILTEALRRSRSRLENNLHELEIAMASRSAAEKALQDNRDLLRTTLSSIGDSVITTDSQGKITFLNPSAERLTGWTSAEAQRQTVSEVFVVLNEQTRLPVMNPTQRSLDESTDAGLGNQTILVNRSGREIPIDESAAPIRDTQQRVFGTVLVFRDVSERRQSELALKKSEEILKLAVTAGQIGIWDWDLEEKRVTLSDRFYEIHGIEKGFFPEAGDQFLDLVHPDDKTAVQQALREAIRGIPPVDFQYRIIRPNGELRWLASTAIVFSNENARIARVLGVTTDITKSKEAEEELRLINRTLVNTNRSLEEFSYVASHDLQEPLRMVNIYTQLLLRRLGNENPDVKQYASVLTNSVERMQIVLRDLLEYSRATNTGAGDGAADLSAALQAAQEVLENEISESGAIIKASSLPVTKGETMQMCHVFQNLLSNAMKYRKKGAQPEIKISARRQLNEWIISVEDNGIGFEPEYERQIFGLFKRLHNREYPGTGLGLAICQRIVERFDGRIWAESKPGEGSKFFFTLPAIPSIVRETTPARQQ